MTQTFYPISPVEKTVDTAFGWREVDCSPNIPSGATGVLLHVANTAIAYRAIGLRKNGSSDNRTQGMYGGSHWWVAIGVDGNRKFQAFVDSTTEIDIYLVGYTMSGVTFLTNAVDKTPGITGSWQPMDCLIEAPSAVGLIFEVYTEFSLSHEFGLRKNGSSDDRHYDTSLHCCFGAIIGCDASQICQGYIEDSDTHFMLVGYITDGATFNTNATDLSLGSALSWLDLTALPSRAVMGFIEITATGPTYKYGLRKNGSAEDIWMLAKSHPWGIVECDASQIIEGKIQATNIDFFLVGYAEGAPVAVEPPAVTALPASAVTSTTARSNGEVTDNGGENPTVHIYWGTSDGETTPANWDHDENLGVKAVGTFYKDISGLTRGTKYYYRCYAVNSEGSVWSNAVEITTLLEKPVAASNAATGVGVSAATLNGTATDDEGGSCQYRFRYKKAGGDYAYTDWVGAKATGETFSEGITGLDASSTYYFNAQVKNSQFESDWGAELTFDTGAAVVAPTGTTDAATLVADVNATLNGTVDGDGGEACEVRFQYGLTAAYGTNTAWQPGKLTNDTFSQEISGLTPNTLYHFRAQIKNSDSTVDGADETFTTEYFPTPFIRRVLRDMFGGGADISAANPLPVDTSAGLKVATEILNEAEILTGATTALGDCDAIDLSDGDRTLAITLEATYDGGATQGIKIHVRTSHDGTNWDTIDWDSWAPSFTAGATIRQTKHYDVSPYAVKVLVENLDGAKSVTDVKIIATVGP